MWRLPWDNSPLPERCHLDMETFAEPRDTTDPGTGRIVTGVDLVKDGVWNYARHPNSGCYMFGIKMDHELTFVVVLWRFEPREWGWEAFKKTETELFQEYPQLARFLRAIAASKTVVAHNAAFERHCWNHIVVDRYFPGWPKLQIRQQDCTMARANAMCLPAGLESLAHILRLKNKKKDSSLMKLLASTTPANVVVVTPSSLHEEAIYCAADVEAEAEADQLLYPLRPLQRRVWEIDQEINDRGIPTDVHAIRKALKIVEAAKEIANARIHQLTGGAVKTAQQATALKDWLNTQIALAWTTEGHEDAPPQLDGVSAFALKTHSEEYGWPDDRIREVLELREIASRSSVSKLQAILDQLRLTTDGRVRHQYVFMGAGPGRFTGRGIQPQNLVRFDDDTQPLADALLDTLRRPETEEILSGSTPAARRRAAEAAAAAIQERTGKNAILVISKCMRIFLRAPQ